MTHISAVLLEMLMRDGMSAGSAGRTGHSPLRREIKDCKLTEPLKSGRVVSASRLSFGAKDAHVGIATTNAPTAGALVDRNSLEPGRAPARQGAVSAVLDGIAKPQVGNSVVRLVPVHMIKHAYGELPMNQRPSQPVSQVGLLSVGNADIAISATIACDRTFSAVDVSDELGGGLPGDKSAVRFVAENFTQLGDACHSSLRFNAGDYAQGKIARTAGTGAAGIGAGDQSGGTDRLLTGLREGGDRNPMGNSGKGTPTEAGASQQGGRKGVYQEPSPTRGRPVLRLIVSNKYLDVASPTRMPRAATSRYLVLV